MSHINQLIAKQAEAVEAEDFQLASDLEAEIQLQSENRWGLE